MEGGHAEPRHLEGDLGAMGLPLAGDTRAPIIEVRATDGTGAVQTATPGGPAPAGATGYDQVQVTVA